MKLVEADLISDSPYSQSRQDISPRNEKETHEDHEVRTWREKCTTNDSGEIVIPAMAFKQALDSVAKRLGHQIPGKGKSTYTKHFVGGVICTEDAPLGVMQNAVASIPINANSDGVRGSGKRVKRIFPIIYQWKATVKFAILDDTVTKKVFEEHLREAGRFIGIGRFRPEKGGLNGRFSVTALHWKDI